MNEKAYPIEPALLVVFRLFAGLRIAYSAMIVLLALVVLRENAGYMIFLSLLVAIGLFLYLTSAKLQRKLGRYYLPIALAVITLALIVEHQGLEWRIAFRWDEFISPPDSLSLLNLRDIQPALTVLDNSWPPLIYVPLVLVAWQYNFRTVLLYILGIIAASLALYSLLFGLQAEPLDLIIIIIGRLFAFGVVGYAVVRLSNALREQRNALREANVRLINHLSTQEQLTTSQERNRLARELHDTLAHSLSATTIQLEASSALWESNPPKARDLQLRALQTTRDGLTETRRALEALRASPLDDLGLLLSLRQLATESAERSGYRLALDLPSSLPALPPQTEQAIYRCAQESLSNVARHAGAKTVRVQLIQQNEHIELSISDDGRGFELG